MKKVILYTDGACSGNPGPGGWGAVLMCGDLKKEISGAEENKIEKAGFHALRSEFVDAPLFEELPLTLECRVVEMSEVYGVIRIVGEVVNMSADESILGEDGLVDADKLQALSFDRVRKVYRTLGGVVGQAYADGKKLL